MKFNYKVNIEVDVEFEAPLLGADSTIFRRKQTDQLVRKAVSELLGTKTSVINIEREVKEDNLLGTIKSSKTLSTVNKK